MSACHAFSLFGNDQAAAIFDMQPIPITLHPALPYLEKGRRQPSWYATVMSACHAFTLTLPNLTVAHIYTTIHGATFKMVDPF